MRLSVIGLRGFPMIEGGVEKHCEALYPLLNKDIDITVYRRSAYVKSKYVYDNISFIDLPSTRIKGLEPALHSLIASIDALIKKPDVIHYHNIGPALFCPLMKIRKIPVVLTYHSPNYEHNKWGRLAKAILRLSEKVALKNADKIVFVNYYQMQKYNMEIRRKSIYVPNGLNYLPHSERTDFLEKCDLEKGRYILSVGRITPEKGFDVLIKAFRLADKKGYKLVIAGGVEFEDSYMRKLKRLSGDTDVIFTGYIYGDDLHQLYTNAGLYVLASKNEGFPLVLLEAMSYGLDILASDIPATHLVELEADSYFKLGDYRDLAEKISSKIKENKKKKYDLSKYNWVNIADKMSSIFHEVVKK